MVWASGELKMKSNCTNAPSMEQRQVQLSRGWSIPLIRLCPNKLFCRIQRANIFPRSFRSPRPQVPKNSTSFNIIPFQQTQKFKELFNFKVGFPWGRHVTWKSLESNCTQCEMKRAHFIRVKEKQNTIDFVQQFSCNTNAHTTFAAGRTTPFFNGNIMDNSVKTLQTSVWATHFPRRSARPRVFSAVLELAMRKLRHAIGQVRIDLINGGPNLECVASSACMVTCFRTQGGDFDVACFQGNLCDKTVFHEFVVQTQTERRCKTAKQLWCYNKPSQKLKNYTANALLLTAPMRRNRLLFLQEMLHWNLQFCHQIWVKRGWLGCVLTVASFPCSTRGTSTTCGKQNVKDFAQCGSSILGRSGFGWRGVDFFFFRVSVSEPCNKHVLHIISHFAPAT